MYQRQTPLPGYYWPPKAFRSEGIEGLVGAFQEIGYEQCRGKSIETGFEKVALYVDQDGFWTHAAKQRTGGEWTSKLGDCGDIHHRTPHAVASTLYGQVMYYMRRPVMQDQNDAKEDSKPVAEGTPQEPINPPVDVV